MPENWGFDDSLGKAVLIESTKRMSDALGRLKHIEMWTWQDAYDFVTVGVWNEKEQGVFFEMFRTAQEGGAPTPALGIKDLDIILRKSISTSFHVVDRIAGLTGLGSMVFSPDEGMRSFHIYNPTILTANYTDEGNFGRISGVPGSGKTNTGCVIVEQYAKEPNHVCLGNIRMTKTDERFRFCPDAKTFFMTLSTLPKDSRWLFTLDEAGLIYAKPDQATRRVKDLDKFMRVVRKLRGSVNLIEQREDAVPTLIQEFAKNLFYCESKGIVSIEMRGPNLAFRDTVKDFPKTTLPFDTYDIAYFPINVDIQRLLGVISGADEPMNAIREYFESEERPVKTYLGRVCAFPGCGKSLVGMSPTAKYCSSQGPPWHAQLDRRRRLALEGNKEETLKDETLEEFLHE